MDSGNGTGMYMPVAPAYGGGYGNGFGMGWGGDGWLIILFLFALMGNGFGGWGGFGGGNGMLGVDFPWLLNGQNGINANTNAGFNQAATQSALSGIQSSITSGFGDVQTSLCGGFANTIAAVNGAQNAVAQQMYTNQIADLERSFAVQTANTQGMSAIQSQLAQCCCDNRLATAQTQALVQSENCADRQVLSDGIRDIIANQTAGTQRIIDQLCADKIDAKNEKIAELQNQLNFANMSASQTAQTARLLADNQAQTQAIEQYLNPVPIPAYVVQNPNCCVQNYGCGCGM